MMINKLLSILPRYPARSLGYTMDYLIAFLPAIIISCIYLTTNIATGLAVALLASFVLEACLCIFMKKEFDLTIAVRVLALCICIPCDTPLTFYLLGGALIFAFSNLRRFTDKYISLEPVVFTVIILLLMIPRVYSPTHSVVEGLKFGSVSVWDLLMGYKSRFFGAGNLFALFFAYVYLSLRKRIHFIHGALFYAVLIAVLAFLYEGTELNAIYYVSFIALDANVFFPSLFLLGFGTLPFEKKGAYVFSILGGAALGFVTLKLGLDYGAYYVLGLMSILSRPTELLVCKLKHRKKAASL